MRILFEDNALLVVDKPAGLTVNKSETTKEGETLQDWAEEKLGLIGVRKEIKQKTSDLDMHNKTAEDYEQINRQAFYERAGIVHRLDKETSGILIIAKNPEAFIELLRQFRERVVKKNYLALIHGKITPVIGEIRVPVGRLSWNRKRFGVVPGGRESVTKYKTLVNGVWKIANRKEEVALVELFPETGRTHQIRVHMKYMNHPIVSDILYGGRKTAHRDRKVLGRLFLHASKITFSHPVTQSPIEVESKLPEDLQAFLDQNVEKIVE